MEEIQLCRWKRKIKRVLGYVIALWYFCSLSLLHSFFLSFPPSLPLSAFPHFFSLFLVCSSIFCPYLLPLRISLLLHYHFSLSCSSIPNNSTSMKYIDLTRKSLPSIFLTTSPLNYHISSTQLNLALAIRSPGALHYIKIVWTA